MLLKRNNGHYPNSLIRRSIHLRQSAESDDTSRGPFWPLNNAMDIVSESFSLLDVWIVLVKTEINHVEQFLDANTCTRIRRMHGEDVLKVVTCWRSVCTQNSIKGMRVACSYLFFFSWAPDIMYNIYMYNITCTLFISSAHCGVNAVYP